jgi:GAF domain-containing protein
MIVCGRRIAYACLRCSHEWIERRNSSPLPPGAPLSDDDLHRTVQAICAARDAQSVMGATGHWARYFTGADGVTFVLRAGESCYYADENAIAPLWKGQRFALTACVAGWVMLRRESVLIPDVYADARVPHAAYRPTFVKSMLMVPVRKSDPVAAIGAYWQTASAPTPQHVRVLELMAEAAAIRLAGDQPWARAKDAFRSLDPA